MSAPTAEASTTKSVKVDPLKLKVLDARILIHMVAPNERTEGGLFLPPKAQEDKATAFAEVIAIGGGRITEQGITIPLRVKPGERVLVGKYAGTPVSRDGTFKIINEIEILAVDESGEQ